MPIFYCEFDVSSDLVLSADLSELHLNKTADTQLLFRNAAVDVQGNPTGLIATVIASSESIDTAQEELRSILAGQLDLLSFVTHSCFKITSPRRLVEWDAGKKVRNFRTYFTSDSRYPPDPELAMDFINTIGELEKANPPSFARKALKYFRYGLMDHQHEDQFMHFWLALEIVAENTKPKTPHPIICSACNAAMKCSSCGFEPTRVPIAKQEIETIIAKIVGDVAKEVSNRQFRTRNCLMHGGSPETIEKECNMPLALIVNELGEITWNAIMSTMFLEKGTQLTFGSHEEGFARRSLMMSVLGTFEHTGDDLQPTTDKIPDIDIKMVTTFGPSTQIETPD